MGLYDTEAKLEKMRDLLIGKTILKVGSPTDDEAIFWLHFTDGTGFQLYANELGYWTEATQ
jgi:hypothetical protein